MKHSMKSIIYALTIIYLFTGPALAVDPLSVFVSISPQRYFVQQIGRDLVDVQVLVEPGADPHTYEPKPRQMAALSKAALYFAVGIEFETARLDKLAAINPRLRVVHTDHGIMKLPMAHLGHHEESGTHTDDHGGAGTLDHDHEGRDPHIWLSPPLVMLQARSILTALQAADPPHRTDYEANYRSFIMDVLELDAHLRETFDGLNGASFMVFHPSWGTFAHTYGLNQVPIEIEGKSPKPAQLRELIEHARSERIKVVFVQPQFSSKSADQVAKAIGGRVAVVDPMAEDWAANLRRAAEEFKHALK